MKKFFLSFFLLSLAFVFTIHPAFCEAAPARVAVLPFKINAMKDYSFLQDGVQDMLTSRLFWEGKVLVIDKDSTNAAFKSVENFTGKNRALLVGAKLNADYIVYGSLTILGENASIDARITDISGENEPTAIFKQIDSAGLVIPEINRFATDINTMVFQRPLPKSFQPVQPGTPNQQFLSQQNQNFIMKQPSGQQQEFWKSRTFEFPIIGMDYGDVNNDGKDETVFITNHAVYIYQNTGSSFTQIARVAENKISSYISVDVGDINQNGPAEIFVSAIVAQKDKANSFVIEYTGTEYRTLLKESQWYYRIVKPVKSKPILMAQRQEYRKGDIYSSPVSVMESNGITYSPSEMVLKSDQANVLGVVYDDLDGNGQKRIIAFNKQDYINIYNGPARPLWTGQDKLGGNMSRFFVEPEDTTNEPIPFYFPMRLRTADTNQDGKIEVIAAANHDKVGSMVAGFRAFKQSEIQALAWDSLGLRPIWNTRKLTGRVTDFFIDDFDNDGITEIVISIIEKENSLIPTKSRSHIVAYDLMVENK